MFAPTRPDRLARSIKVLKEWGTTVAGGYHIAALRFGGEIALIDELGSLTFAEVHERTNALAHAWAQDGIGEDDAVAILCRNHRGFVEALVTCSKLGAHAVLLNTAFAGRQLEAVCAQERPVALVYDEEFADAVAGAAAGRRRYVAWSDSDAPNAPNAPNAPTLESLIARGDGADRVPPATQGRIVILTSGTTGNPEGRQPQGAQDARPGRLAAVEDPAARPRAHAHRRAAVSLLGAGPPRARRRARVDARPAPALRRGGHAARDRRARRDGAHRRAGDAAADRRVRAAGRAPLRHRHAARHRGERVGAARRARHPGHGRLRRHPLQPLRLDRGGVGDDRHARRPARRPGHRGQPAARHDRAPLRRCGQRGRRPARPAASSSATSSSSTATRAAARRRSSTA